MTFPAIAIHGSTALRPVAGGPMDEGLLCPERRSPKVGVLSTQARLVVEAARRCLDGHERPAGEIIGLSLGTLCGANDIAERSLRTAHATGIADVSASWYATGLPNSTSGVAATMADLRGPNLTLLGYQAGLEAIIMACRMLRSGRARRMLAGGFDVPGEGETERLQQAPDFRSTRVLAGVGLLLLAPWTSGSSPLASVVGWSYGETADADHDALIAAAVRQLRPATPVALPTRHVLSPGGAELEYLAAACPILLAQILTSPARGLHAFIVEGRGLRPVCLVIEIHADGRHGAAS